MKSRLLKAQSPATQYHNLLLAQLEQEDLAAIEPYCDTISLSSGTVLADARSASPYVYFLTHGIASLVTPMADGNEAGLALVGREGFVGVSALLGAPRSMHAAVAQTDLEALRLDSGQFRAIASAREGVFELAGRYTQTLFNQIAQSVACQSIHTVEERMCRWLLMCHDRADGDEFPLTQEFLARMLGARRPTVTIVAGLLQKSGLIGYSRGRMVVLNRAGLEAATCECYAAVRREDKRLLGLSEK
jgi:CRP-like cAMP-binding protein